MKQKTACAAFLTIAAFSLSGLLAHSATAQLDNLEFVGHEESNPFHLMHAEIVGNRVYVSEGLGTLGMETYDVSDPAAIVRIDQDGPTTWRTRAYPEWGRLVGFAHGSGVQIYDISGPATDLLMEYLPEAGTSYEGGAWDGEILTVAAHQRGIDRLSAVEPGPIVFLDRIDLGDNAAWDCEQVGEVLLVANGRFGLTVVDLAAQPPAVIRTISLPGLANDVLVVGSLGVLSLGPGGLATFDLSDPADPVLLDHNTETHGNVTQIDVAGSRLVAGAWTRLELYDLTDPSNVALLGAEDTKTWAMGASIDDDPEDPIIAVADWRGVSTYRPNPDAGPDIEISTPRIDFGFVESQADTVVTVFNRGLSVLEVADIVPPAGFSVAPRTFSLASGQAQEIMVTASGPGDVRSFLRYLSNDPDEPSVRQYVYKNNATFPQIGAEAPDFTLTGNDGQQHTLSDYRGKVVFLEFGASW